MSAGSQPVLGTITPDASPDEIAAIVAAIGECSWAAPTDLGVDDALHEGGGVHTLPMQTLGEGQLPHTRLSPQEVLVPPHWQYKPSELHNALGSLKMQLVQFPALSERERN